MKWMSNDGRRRIRKEEEKEERIPLYSRVSKLEQ